MNQWTTISAFIWFGILTSPSLSIAQPAEADPLLDLVPRPQTCAADFQGLVQQMLPALPSFANRIYTRSGLERKYMVVASEPDFESLPIQTPAAPSAPVSTSDLGPQQVFFTTLTRQYRNQKIEDLQDYHWLFLVRSETGWRFSMLYSIAGQYPQKDSPPPPRNSSEGAIAVAIQDWLRDCRFTR